MVGAIYLGVDGCAFQVRAKALRGQEIVDAPPGILLAGPKSVRPPTVNIFLVGMKVAECVYEAAVEQLTELFALFIREACILAVRLRIFQVDFLMRYIQVTAHHYGFLLVERGQVVSDGIFPFHAIGKAAQTILRIGDVEANEIEGFKFERDGPSFGVAHLVSDAVGYADGLLACEYGRARIAFFLSVVPKTLITLECKVELSGLHLGFLQAHTVGIELLEDVLKSFFYACAQSVYIPRD